MAIKSLPASSAPLSNRVSSDTIKTQVVTYERVKANAFDLYNVYCCNRWLGMIQYLGNRWCLFCNSPVLSESYGSTRYECVKFLLLVEGLIHDYA